MRRKKTHSMGFTSVPVEIMSTVTAMRGKKLLRKLARISSGVRLEVFTHSVTSRLGAVVVLHLLRDLGEAGAVGDLLAEVVSLGEHLAHDADDVVGVGVVLGEDERLGHLGAAGEGVGQHLVAELLEDGADLAFGDDVAVELVGGVGEVLTEQFEPLGAGELVALVHIDAGVAGDDGGALLGDAGADAVNVEVHVDAVGDGLVVAVLHDEVLIEEADGLAGGRGGEADQEGIEVEQHLAPQLVDGAVALVHDDEVEELGRDAGVVDHIGRLALPRLGGIEGGALFVAGVELGLALEHRVEALDGGDDDLGGGVDGVGLEPLDGVERRELARVVGRRRSWRTRPRSACRDCRGPPGRGCAWRRRT